MSGAAPINRCLLTAALALAAAAGAWPAKAAPAATGAGDPVWRWPAAAPLCVYSFRGYWYPVFQLERAWARLGGVDETSRWSGPRIATPFPSTPGSISRYHLIVVVDMDVPSWPSGTLELCREYVRQGGAMLFFGGRYAFAAGYRGSPLEELCPVTFQSDDGLAQAPEGLVLTPGPHAAELAAGPLNWGDQPRAYRYRKVEPKPGALVLAQAGTHPILMAGRFGAGRVAVFAGTVMGEPAAGQIPFWLWRDWPALMAGTVRWLTAPVAERPEAPPERLPPAASAREADPDVDALLTATDRVADPDFLPDPETERRRAADRHRIRVAALAALGDGGQKSSIPLLRGVIGEHRRDRKRDPHEGRGRTEADELHDEAALAAVLCGDESAARPLVELLLQLDYTAVGLWCRGWQERDAARRAELHAAAQSIRSWSWKAAERLRRVPPALLPSLAARIAEEEDPGIVPLAHRLFGRAFREGPLPAAVTVPLRASPIPAVAELVTN